MIHYSRKWLFVVALLTYVALSNNWRLNNVLLGTAVALLIVIALPTERRPLNLGKAPAQLWAILIYVFSVAVDVIWNGFQVARIVLSPRMPIYPGVVIVPTGTTSQMAQALSAHAITISPGEMVVHMDDDGNMHVHCLDIRKGENMIREAQRKRRNALAIIFDEEAQ